MTDKRYRFGICVTVLYLLTLAIYSYLQRHAVLVMSPNELGDALAGAASPLAFLWLVLGYLQQGEELRQNTHALNLQVKELQASVDQQKALVETTQRRHELELARDREQRRSAFLSSQPVFDLKLDRCPPHIGENKFYVTLTNMGRLCSRLLMFAPDDESIRFDTTDDELIFNGGTAREWTVQLPTQYRIGDAACLIVYTDWNGEEQRQRFTMAVSKRSNGELLAFVLAPPVLVTPWEGQTDTS